MQTEQFVDGIIERESCILVHEALKRSWQVVFPKNFLGKILLKDGPRDLQISRRSVIENRCRAATFEDIAWGLADPGCKLRTERHNRRSYLCVLSIRIEVGHLILRHLERGCDN